jgi:hypothetical protein
VPSELYVQVPVRYGDFYYAAPGTPLFQLFKYGSYAPVLLNFHLRMVMYSRQQEMDGFFPDGVADILAYPASQRVARRDLKRLADAGFIKPREGGYFVPAAVEWEVVRTGSRDPIPGSVRKRVHERDGWRCVECGSAENLTLDHINPWSKGGSDKISNLRTLCGSCNSAKGARVG